MNFASVNFLAILAAAVANLLLGFLWYGPLFGKPWMKLGANAVFGQKKFPLYLIDTGYPIVSLVIAGAILGAWR
jgi:hypothetical protein